MRYAMYSDGAYCSRTLAGTGSFAVYRLEDGDDPVNDSIHAKLSGREPLFHASRFSVCQPKGIAMSNNIAEARTFEAAIIWAIENGLLAKGNLVHLFLDSQCVLCQFTGLYEVRKKYLLDIYRQIHALLEKQGREGNFRPRDVLRLRWVSGEVMKAGIIGH